LRDEINDEARTSNFEEMTKSENRKTGTADSFWDENAGVVREEPAEERVYDLKERTARFGEAIIDFAKAIPQNPVTNCLVTQLVAAGTSVGANYVEADDSVSKKDFLKSIGTCRKEARETKHFLRMIVRAMPELRGSDTLARSERIEPNLLENLEQVKNTSVMQLLSYDAAKTLRDSSFIRA
jgi:four helix bundle protein